jgi:DNA mismatch repair protein MutL
MGKINVLDKHVAELIAAGEVVERPASVVKELAENSVDAGSTAVTVEITGGGVPFLRITDNGCGIAREDVAAAFLRHATSKVRSEEDLAGISTLGFRGEALASIAAVAHVEMLTRTASELAGTRYEIDGGGEQACEDAGCAEGTTIVVRDLFYNTPARLKFLKKDTTEGNAIAGVLDKVALSRPDLSLRFLRDGREVLHTPGDGKLKSAVYAVYGKEFVSGLIPVRYELGGIKVEGFVSKPSAARPNRSMQNFFINSRYVKSRTAMVALEEAFKGSLMVGKVPACALHLTVPFGAVDVNVHPSKIEVRFINEKPIFDAVYHGVKSALNAGDTPQVVTLGRREVPLPERDSGEQTVLHIPMRPEEKSVPAFASVPPVPARNYAVNDVEPVVEIPPLPSRGPEKTLPPAPRAVEPSVQVSQPVPEQPREAPRPGEVPGRFVGEAFGTYIMMERGDELVFIDKHAAHERMLYEKLKAQGGRAFQQMLLQPVTVTLDKSEYSAALESIDVFGNAGFELEDFGSGTVLVRSAPMILGGEEISDAVMEIAGYLQSSKNDVTTEKLDWLYHNVACRAAVKAGDSASPQELYELALRVEKEDVRYCPHGRPVLFILRRRELERQFGRVQ